MMGKNTGFTLLELLFSVAVLGIILAIGVPSFDSFIKKSHADNSVQRFANIFSFARSQAVSLGDAVTVCHLNASNTCDGDWAGSLTAFVDSNRDRSLASTEVALTTTEALGSDDIIKTTAISGVMFLPDGRLSAANNFTLRFCPGSATSEYSRGFIMSLTGRIRYSSDENGDGRHQLDGTNVSC